MEFYCPRWGSENIPWQDFMDRVQAAGYDGIEYAIDTSVSMQELDMVWELADKRNLRLIAQHYGTDAADFGEHRDIYGCWLERLLAYPMAKLNSQTGKDWFTFDQNMELLALSGDMAGKADASVVHETHRGKFSFAAHVTERYLQKMPNLRLTLDASHWCNVAESLLEDQSRALHRAIGRTDHIHARIGYAQGPQVPDPRCPEWREARQVHLDWWDRVAKLKSGEGSVLTVTPEFGPFPYMVHSPVNRKPLANQWTLNLWMMNVLKERWERM
ncbi:sugar phosphate isomerase/epimerase family protein [Parapedobacter defluvii]|nr:TIM barrel protein [Parapedobacter defluvii]